MIDRKNTFSVGNQNRNVAGKMLIRLLVLLLLASGPVVFADTNLPGILPTVFRPVTVGAPSPAVTNATKWVETNLPATMDPFLQKLETARYLRKVRQLSEVEPLLVSLLANDVPESIQRSALLELAGLARDQNDAVRAEQVYAQFLNRWPDDPRVPEVLLNQGRLFRQMGLHELALTKFYAVMTAALTLKSDRLDYYERLVAEAQVEIAETHFRLGKYAEAAEYFSRLFHQDNADLDKQQILYRLVQCYSGMTNYDLAVGTAGDFLRRYANSPEEPEVRFDLATALKGLGQNNESLQQVLLLLQEQSAQAPAHPENWAYWQQRAGNLIANQFYHEGDYPRALEIYTSLAQLDASPQWQVPVWYQIAMTYEHLMQPEKAADYYNRIVRRQPELGTNAAPGVESIVDMARWRAGFLQWQNHAELSNRRLADTNAALTAAALKPGPTHE